MEHAPIQTCPKLSGAHGTRVRVHVMIFIRPSRMDPHGYHLEQVPVPHSYIYNLHNDLLVILVI
jgi:hypothetical protein